LNESIFKSDGVEQGIHQKTNHPGSTIEKGTERIKQTERDQQYLIIHTLQSPLALQKYLQKLEMHFSET